MDHIIPLSWADEAPFELSVEAIAELDLIDNIQPLCKRCNIRKGTKAIDYRWRALQRRQLLLAFHTPKEPGDSQY